MIRLAVGIPLMLALLGAHGQTMVEYREGRVSYSGACESSRSFSYFDGSRLQRACIGSTDEFSVARIVQIARFSTCRDEIRLNHGEIENGVLYAYDVEEGRDCSDSGRGVDFP